MKLFFTLFILFSFSGKNARAQIDILPVKSKPSTSPSSVETISESNTKVNFEYNIRKMAASTEPLLVIDGVPYAFDTLQKIDPNNIESITILKNDFNSPIVVCHAWTSVILVTTRYVPARKFIIKDFLTGEKIPAATIRFTSIKDSINIAADENGSLITDKLKTGTKYVITVSSSGYKTFSTPVTKQQEIFLERDVKECNNVIVSTTACWKRTTCYGFVVKAKRESPTKITEKIEGLVYPNPVQRNNVFNLEFENTQDETMQLAIVNLNGALVYLQSQKINKGANHLFITADAKWAAGIYVIQLRNEKGKVIKQEKLIVQ